MWVDLETIHKETEITRLKTIQLEGDYLSKILVRNENNLILFEINFRPYGEETEVWITSGTHDRSK